MTIGVANMIAWIGACTPTEQKKVIYFRLFVYPRIRRALYLTLSVLPSVMVGLGAKSLSWVVFRFKKVTHVQLWTVCLHTNRACIFHFLSKLQ